MTLKGYKNYYNVKFLKGYGFSIKVNNSKLVLKNYFDPFKEPEVEEWYVNKMPYEKIVMSGKGYGRTREGKVVMDYNLIRRFLELLEKAFQMERRYDFRHGMKTSDGLKLCQELTIAKIVVQNLADYCIGKRNNLFN